MVASGFKVRQIPLRQLLWSAALAGRRALGPGALMEQPGRALPPIAAARASRGGGSGTAGPVTSRRAAAFQSISAAPADPTDCGPPSSDGARTTFFAANYPPKRLIHVQSDRWPSMRLARFLSGALPLQGLRRPLAGPGDPDANLSVRPLWKQPGEKSAPPSQLGAQGHRRLGNGAEYWRATR